MRTHLLGSFLVAVAGIALIDGAARAQLAERPGNSTSGPTDPIKDLTGRSIKTKRVRAIHTTDPTLVGGTAYFLQVDPWVGYQLGRNLEQRQYRNRDGVFPSVSVLAGGPSSDGFTPDATTQHTTSCGDCHNVPYRGNGGGTNIASHSGDGRNSPHFMGIGVMEILALQLRLKILELGDTNRDGWLGATESIGRRILISPEPGAPPLDFGRFGDTDGNGKPNLNAGLVPFYVDPSGQWLPGATSLTDSGVAGYNFMLRPFGWGELRGGNQASIRVFLWAPFIAFTGIQTYDPTINRDPDFDGLSQVSLPGAQQFTLFQSPDQGRNLSPLGVSLDDPDGDGYLNELTEGDADLLEWYLLNAPAPARVRPFGISERGRGVFKQIGCNRCHVENWLIDAADPNNPDYTKRYDGDRRFFDLEVNWNNDRDRLEGRVVNLSHQVGNRMVPNRGSFLVRGIYSDLMFHDLGPAFYETQFDGSTIKLWRTPALWGAGSIPPFGHDGKSFTFDEVIRRHGGEATQEAQRYGALSRRDRGALNAFLESLVVYQADDLPTDINGDGIISPNFMVAGKNTGEEKFNPEWLFNTPISIEGDILAPDGSITKSYAGMNIDAAYGQLLPYYIDSDDDGWPDLLDPAPNVTGYKDGVNN